MLLITVSFVDFLSFFLSSFLSSSLSYCLSPFPAVFLSLSLFCLLLLSLHLSLPLSLPRSGGVPEDEAYIPTYLEAFPPLPEKGAPGDRSGEPAGAWNRIRPIKASVITQVPSFTLPWLLHAYGSIVDKRQQRRTWRFH